MMWYMGHGHDSASQSLKFWRWVFWNWAVSVESERLLSVMVVDTALLSLFGFGMTFGVDGHAQKVQGLKPNARSFAQFAFQESKIFGVAYLPWDLQFWVSLIFVFLIILSSFYLLLSRILVYKMICYLSSFRFEMTMKIVIRNCDFWGRDLSEE